MPTDPPTTPNYNFPLIPPLDSEYRDEWGFLINDGTFSDGTSSSSTDGLIEKVDTVINDHVTDTTNPHNVNYSQTGAIQDANSTVTRSNISPSFYTQSEANNTFLEQNDGLQTYTEQDSVSDAGTENPVVFAGSFTPRASHDGGNVWLSVSDVGSGEGGSAQFLITLGYSHEPTIYSFGESVNYPDTLNNLNFYWRTPSAPHRTEIAVEHTGGNSGKSLTLKTAAWGVGAITSPNSTTLADYSSTSTHKYVAADGNGDVNISGGTLSEQSNRVATRTWATGNNISHSELADSPSAAHHAKYTDSEAVNAVNAETSLTVDISGDSDTVDGYEGDDLARPKNVAVLTSTDTSTGINQTSWTVIPWDNQLDIDAGYTHDPASSPGQITFDNDGTYRVKAMITYDCNGNQRINPGVRLSINGTRRDALGLSGYVRNGSGHNEGSNYIEETITVNSGDTLRVEAYRYGNNGYVTMRSNESELIIEQVSKTVSISGDTDTVDGYHAADFVLAGGDTMSGDLNLGSNNLDMTNGARIREENNGRFGFRDRVNNNYTDIEVNRVYYHDTNNWFDGSHDSLSSVGSSDHHSKYTDSEAVSAVESGSPVMSTTLNMSSNDINNVSDIEMDGDIHGSGVDIDVRQVTRVLGPSNTDTTLTLETDGDGTHGIELRDGFNATNLLTASEGGPVNTPGTDLQERGNRVATRTWATGSNINHSDLADAPSSAHHSRYSDSEARSALTSTGKVGGSGLFFDFDNSNNWIELVDGNGNRDQLVTEDVYINQTGDWLGNSHLGVSDAHHSKTSSASELTDVSPDSTSDAHHSRYSDEEAQDAVGAIVGKALSYDDGNNSIDVSEGNISHDNISGVSSGDHHSKTSSASELTDVSADSVSDAHHSRYTDNEARGAIESGNVDRIQFNNTEFDSNYHSNQEAELAWDDSEGLQFYWNGSWRQIYSEGPTDVNPHHDNLRGISSSDHHSRYSDTEARTAVDGANIDISGDADTVDGFEATDLARPKNIAVLTSTDTSTDINTGSNVPIPFNRELQIDAGFSHSNSTNPDELTFDDAGTYKIIASLSFSGGGGSRMNPNVRLSLNGTILEPRGASGYIRNREGHDEASSDVFEVLTVNSGDTLRVETIASADTSTVTLRANESRLIVEQVSETVARSDDADTVDGNHASDFASDNHNNTQHSTNFLAQSDYNPESDTHSRYSDSEARGAVNGNTITPDTVNASSKIVLPTYATLGDVPTDLPEGTQVYVTDEKSIYVEDGT